MAMFYQSDVLSCCLTAYDNMALAHGVYRTCNDVVRHQIKVATVADRIGRMLFGVVTQMGRPFDLFDPETDSAIFRWHQPGEGEEGA